MGNGFSSLNVDVLTIDSIFIQQYIEDNDLRTSSGRLISVRGAVSMIFHNFCMQERNELKLIVLGSSMGKSDSSLIDKGDK